MSPSPPHRPRAPSEAPPPLTGRFASILDADAIHAAPKAPDPSSAASSHGNPEDDSRQGRLRPNASTAGTIRTQFRRSPFLSQSTGPPCACTCAYQQGATLAGAPRRRRHCAVCRPHRPAYLFLQLHPEPPGFRDLCGDDRQRRGTLRAPLRFHSLRRYVASWHLASNGQEYMAELALAFLVGYAGIHIRRWRTRPSASFFARGPLLFAGIVLIWMALVFNSYDIHPSAPLAVRIIAGTPGALGIAALVWLLREWRTHRAEALTNARRDGSEPAKRTTHPGGRRSARQSDPDERQG